MPETAEFLQEFVRFTEEQWVEWMQGFLGKIAIHPPLPVFEDRHAEELIALFRRLKDSQASTRFSKALTRVFEATPPERAFAEWIYIELHVLAVVTSDHARRALRRRLQEEVYANLEFARTALHPLLLAMNGVYPVDEGLAHYIRKSARRGFQELAERIGGGGWSPRHREAHRNYVLLGWRLLARKDVEECRDFLDQVFQVLETSEDREAFADELRMAALEHGCRFLLALYLGVAEEPAGTASPKFTSLTTIVAQQVLPFLADMPGQSDDEFSFMLHFLANLDVRYLHVDTLYVILKMVDGMSSREDQELAVQALQLGYRLTDAGWEDMVHSVDDVPAFRNEREMAGIFVPYTGTLKKLHRERDKGVLAILSRTLPQTAYRIGSSTMRMSERGERVH